MNEIVVVLYLVSTSNHNNSLLVNLSLVLSYILFLHQTTTLVGLELVLQGCLISCFYIKPQLMLALCAGIVGCLISCFYIKPQQRCSRCSWSLRCLISCFYIKPQQLTGNSNRMAVVLYLVSTSNHNCSGVLHSIGEVVLYLVSTSNHNSPLLSNV